MITLLKDFVFEGKSRVVAFTDRVHKLIDSDTIKKFDTMMKCPDCFAARELHKDYPSSFWESFLQTVGIIRVKRCSNCNAAVLVVLGLFPVSRYKWRNLRDRIFWFSFIFLLLIVGYVVFEAIVG